MDFKKMILVIGIFLLIPFLASASIENYTVSDEVYLNERVNIFGAYQDLNNLNSNIICSTYFFNDENVLVERANDVYTDGSGYFSNSFYIYEPSFLRGEKYLVKSVCSDSEGIGYFTVLQKRDVGNFLSNEFEYYTNNNNVDSVLSILFAISIIAIPIGIFYIIYRWVRWVMLIILPIQKML